MSAPTSMSSEIIQWILDEFFSSTNTQEVLPTGKSES